MTTETARPSLTLSVNWSPARRALAAVIDESRDLTLATTVSLPVLRGPVQLAKTLAALDVLSDGRLLVGVGPGSSARDYAAVGLAFDDRGVHALRGLDGEWRLAAFAEGV